MKARIIILTIILLALSVVTVSAADALYRMTNPEYFPGDQDAMLLGQIIEVEGNISTITVLKVLNGSIENDTIQVDGKFTYLGFSQEHFEAKVGDFCIIPVKKYDDVYKVVYPDRAILADSGDYETLKCYYEDYNYGGGDVPAIQWYVNSGGIENGFGFGSGRVNVTRPNGETIDITDVAVRVTFDEAGNMVIVDSGNDNVPNPQTSSSYDYTGVAIFLILTGISLLFVRRKVLALDEV